MSTGTAIKWTETTWNAATGCDRISPGCDHCHALTLAKRLRQWVRQTTSATVIRGPAAPGSGSQCTRTPCSSRYGGVGRARCS
nr:DUF5131 family protein [Streptomyces sp. cf386]